MAWKVIKCFLACIRSIPVLFITLILLWSYYAYVAQLCLFTVENVAEKVLYLIFYHPLAILMAWSYWKAIFTPISTTPKQFFLSESDVEQFEIESTSGNRKEFLEQWAKELPLQCRLTTGGIRFCEKCKAVKPDRAHHCSICDRCVLKMDHHCPWINNCVCFSTYKFFLLFLMYALFYCIYVASTSLHYFIRFWTRIGGASNDMQGLHIVFLFIASLLFGVCLTTLFGYHCYLVARNKSTIEAYQTPVFSSGPDKDGFSIGWSENFLQVFGTDKRFWLLPIFSSIGDGVSFPSRNTLSANYYHSMETTAPAFSISETIQSPPDGLSYHVTLNDTDGDHLLGQSSQRLKISDSHASNGSSQGYFYNAGNEDINPS